MLVDVKEPFHYWRCTVRTWMLFALAASAVVLAGAAVSTVVPDPLSGPVLAVPVLLIPLSARMLSRRRRAERRADQPDSIENERAEKAAAQTLPVVLVLLVALGAWFVVDGAYGAAALVYAACALSALAYAMTYALLRHQSTRDR